MKKLIFKKEFEGQRLRITFRDQFKEVGVAAGICTFSGFNDLLNLNQVTIDRTPIFERDIIRIDVV